MNEDPETIVRNIGEYVLMKHYKKGMESLSPPERTFFVVFEFEMELLNGDASQYLFNSSGDNANEVPYALNTIGATKSSELVKRLLSFFPQQQIPQDEGYRLALLKPYLYNQQYRDLVNDVSDKYCKDEEGRFNLLYKFYEENRVGFAPLDYDVPLSLFECEFD